MERVTKRKRTSRVNIESVSIKTQEKAERQKFIYGQAVSGIMKELSCSWEQARKELKQRMLLNRMSRELKSI